MADQSIGDALQEQWRTSTRDAAFGRIVGSLCYLFDGITENGGKALEFVDAVLAAKGNIYGEDAARGDLYAEDKDNG